MVVITVTNSQMAVSCIERNGIWASNYSRNNKYSSGFVIYQRPIFGLALKRNKVKWNQVLSSRALNCGAISVLSKGESGNGGIVEKEFEFKPTFDEYLKAMESLKSDRQMMQAPNSTRSKSKNDSKGKDDLRALKGDGENGKSGDFEEQLRRENSKLLEQDHSNENYNSISTQEGKIDYKERGSQKLKDATKTRVEDMGNEVRNNLYMKKDKKDVRNKRKPSIDTENGRWSDNQTSIVREIQTNDEFEDQSFKTNKFCGVSSEMRGRYERDHSNQNHNVVSTQEGVAVGKVDYKERGRRNLKDATKMRVEDKGSEVRNDLYTKKDKKDVKVKRKPSINTENGRWSDNQTSIIRELRMNDEYEDQSFKTDKFRRVSSGTSGRYERDHFQGEKVEIKKKPSIDIENARWSDNQNSIVREIRKNDKFQDQSFKTNKFRGVSSGMSGRYERDRDRFQGEKVPDKRDTKSLKPSRRFKPFPDESSDDELETERAAFKSFDFNDVYNKPRISRVDMEERIQRLAKCLNGADIDMPEWMFSKMMRSARIRYSDHSVLRVIQILGRLGNWRRVLQVIEWMESRERFKSHKIRFIYTAALDALGKARRPVEALNVFYSMQQQMSTYPDLVAYHCIAVTLGQAGHMKELFDVIDSMRSPPKKKFKAGILQQWDPRLEPDIVVYNAVLNACVRRKKWEGAFWVLQQLKQQGQQPSTVTYGLVMEVMFACGKYNLVHDFFKKVQKSSIPNALNYKGKEGKTDEALLAIRDMEGRGIIGSAGLYYDLARCLCSAGRSQEALTQIDKICKVANKPLVVTYTGLVQACLDSGKIESGAYIFNHMHNYCSPNLVTCNIMLKGYLDHEKFEEAKGLFNKLEENGNQISNTLDYKDKVIPDIYTFNLMLNACALKHRWDDLECIYKKMLQHGYHFNSKRHLRLILDASRAGKDDLLEITWKHLIQSNQTPPPLLIKEIFRLKLEQDNYVAAFSCITRHPSIESQAFSSKSWTKFISENRHCFQKETLLRLVHEVSALISKSESPNLIFQNMLSSCKAILRTQFRVEEIDQTETVSRLQYETSL
ncbi:hypothetical protein LguiA_024867 [Lonicera macranthoides]